MKIKNLKYIFGLFFGVLFFLNTIHCYVLANQFSPLSITKESRNGPLYLMISSDIPNANDDCSTTYLDKVTATTANGDTLNLHRTSTASTSTTCKQEINTDVFTGDITITVAAGFFEAEDDDGNVYAVSPAGGPQTFHWEADIIGPDMQQLSRTGNNLEVRVGYELVGISSPGINCGVPGKFEVIGGTLNNASSLGSVPMCRLYITTDLNEVTVNVQPGVIVGEGKESGPGSQTFTKPQDCEKPKDGNTGCATTYGPSYTESGSCCVTTCEKPATTTGDCSIHGQNYVLSGGCCVYDPQINCNTTPPTLCKLTDQGTSNYNNQDPVDGNSLIYLKMFSLDNLRCSGNTDIQAAGQRVMQIQTSMVSSCHFTGCVDGKFGDDSSSALSNCATIYCEGKGDGYAVPTLNSEENLVCDDTHELEDGKCCKPIPVCENPKDSDGGCNSYGSGYMASGDCCVFDCNQGTSCDDGEIRSTGSCKCICDSSKKCCGIQLNTVVPFIGDCIEMNTDSSRGDTTSVTSVTAFPILMQGLMKILMSAIMVFSFLMVIVAGLAITTGAFGGSGFTKGKTILKNVIISLILLGCSGLILSLVNPSFFGG